MTTGKLITLEGIEGVGKSSNVQFVADTLKQSGKEVVVTREPGGTQVAEAIRHILLTDSTETIYPKTELLLLYAGRFQHVQQVIKPALAKGQWVVCDRFIDATIAYQGGGREVPLKDIEQLNAWTLGDFVPDCTLLLDAPVEVGFERIKARRQLDRFEKEHQAFFQRIRDTYLSLAKSAPRYHIINAAEPLNKVQAQIKPLITAL